MAQETTGIERDTSLHVNFIVYVQLLQSVSKLCSLSLSISNLLQAISVIQGMNFPFFFESNFPQYNNHSPFSHVEIMLFCIIFMGKNAKSSTKASSEKDILPHIYRMGALQDIIQTDSGSYSAGLQFLFLTIFGNWSHDHSLNNLSDGP